MNYGSFPKLNRWLEFESYDDFLRYRNPHRKQASWQSRIEAGFAQFETLIDNRATEPKIHNFLEEHPYILPGFSDLHHGPYEGIIITKFPLDVSFVTDFAYVACDSQTLSFTCVEIESARKRLFRKDGKFNRDYLDAKQQIVDWLFWAKSNMREAIGCWGKLFNGRSADWYDISFRGYLIFGRRSEIDNRLKQERWSAESASLTSGLQTMTYDRLLKYGSIFCRKVDNNKLAVCSFRDRRFFVKRVVS